MKHLKHLFTALLLLCCMGMAKAEEVTIDGIKYDVVTKAKQATVISGGNYSGDIVIPSEITHNNVVYSVTSIGSSAFEDCKGLTSVEIPNSVTSIRNWAFSGCSGLTRVTIPNSVTSIGSYAFEYCSGLTSITIGNSVTSIGDHAFSGCSGLTNVTIPNSVTSIGNYAFSDCSSLTSVTIPNSVTSIGNYAFSDCSSLTSVTIPNSVTSIGERAFRYCDGLTSVHISDLSAWCNIEFGGTFANPLYYAKNLYLNGELLTNLIIPNGVTKIKNYAFYVCTGLTSVTIPNSVTSIGDYAFLYCSGLTSVTIPNSVTSIGDHAFDRCTGLTSVTIGNSVTSIGDYAFYDCTGLTSVTIPNSVTSIGDHAFSYCSGLTSVTIGTGVKNIDSGAFAKCSNLTDVYCLATSVPSTYSDAFNESYPEYMTLHVPEEAIYSYKTTAPWSSFGTVVTFDGDVTETPKCATPTVLYSNGKLHFGCETEGAEFVTEITSSDFNKFYTNDINLTATYNISVYATATGYENSDIVNATLCWIECECEGDDTGIINIPAKVVLVTSNNGVLHINCSLDGESVAVYTTTGTLIATTVIENGTATVATGLSKGSVAIIKIADKSIKVIVD